VSVRFQRFIRRVAENSEFKAFKNILLQCLEQEAQNKYAQFPAFKHALQDYWVEISNKGEIAKLLFKNYEVIFRTWLTKLFPYRSSALQLSDPEAPTAVDFKLNFAYVYTKEEIATITKTVTAKALEDDAQSVAKRLFFFIVSSMGNLVALTVERPFAFQLAKMDGEEKGTGYEIKTIISGREQ